MKPEFSKPFNLEHAKAGAPIGKTGGGAARFVAYAEEADPSCCVIVIEAPFNHIGTRRKSGRVNETGATDNPNDLAMLPLGLIDGKPVFVGDELVDPTGEAFTPGPGSVGHLSGCRWPAPAKVYPTFDGSLDALAISYTENNNFVESLARVANAALRHAVESGQLIEPDDRAARDMAVAVAVRNAAQSARPVARGYDLSEDAIELAARIAQLDLAVIIASIK